MACYRRDGYNYLMFAPIFAITAGAAKALMSIEADRQAVDGLPIDVAMLASLRETARLVATHYSTMIEGNRLTQIQVQEVLKGAQFPGRERDEREVRHYYRAVEHIEELAGSVGTITEKDIRTIHGWAFEGKANATAYRDGQNVIRDARTGATIYMPPEAKEVPELMKDLVRWINEELQRGDWPVPIIAAIAHYQFATIHPYYDGNGRTARLLTTLILHKSGYGLKGIYSLDEYYARNLQGYYKALTVGPSNNYHLGRAGADVTGFVDYFCVGMAEAFAAVRTQATLAAARGARDESAALRSLEPRERKLLELFRKQQTVTTAEMAGQLGLSPRSMPPVIRELLGSGFLVVHALPRKSRSYRLGATYENLIS